MGIRSRVKPPGEHLSAGGSLYIQISASTVVLRLPGAYRPVVVEFNPVFFSFLPFFLPTWLAIKWAFASATRGRYRPVPEHEIA